MKISVLIIAHNEEAHIRECLDSILSQTLHPDEIVLIAHNCDDKTVEITKGYPKIKVYELITREKGPIHARKYGFEKVSGDIIACIDGDGIASIDWLEGLLAPFQDKKVVAVGGRVWFFKSLMANVASFFFFLTGFHIVGYIFPFFFWGANFACRKTSYESVGGFKSVGAISRKLGLHYPAEDAILAFALRERGKLIFSPHAVVTVHLGSFFDSADRGRKQREDNKKNREIFPRK